MKTFIYNINLLRLSSLIIGLSFLISCQPEDNFENNGLTDNSVNASFSITPIEGATNQYLLKGNTQNVLKHFWDIGLGMGAGTDTKVAYFPDAGTYTITHTAVGRGGSTNSTTQEITIDESDPEGGNMILGGKFETTEDHNQWTILNISSSGAEWTFNDGSATISASGWNQQGIYQALEVEADQEYSIDMRAWGEGSSDTWFEVYVSFTAPVQGSDYSGDTRIGLNTWAGCATSPFEGWLSNIGCSGSGNTFSFNQSGTVYYIIKCGGGNVGQITITDVEMRQVN